MESFLSRYKNPLLLVALVLAQIILLASQIRRSSPNVHEGADVRLVRVWAMEIVSPFERVFGGVGRGIRNTWGGYVWLRGVRDQNKDLRQEVQRLRLEEASLAEDARQGQRLQALLGFKEKYPADLVAAQVIGTSGSENSRVLYLDKGSNDGLAPDMPVITPDGIVGKIRDVSDHSAQVLEISDQTSGAGIMLEKTRIRGVLRGNALGQPEVINMLPDERIAPGERVLTSGGDQVFPRGMMVGTVEKVVPDPERDPYVAILVKPAANLSKLEEVLVITTQADAEPARTAKDLAIAEKTAAQQKAAEVLADKLPTVPLPSATVTAEGELAKPVPVPVAALHPDMYSAGNVKPANEMTPGGAPKPAEGVVADNAPRPGGAAAAADVKPVTTTHVNDDGTTTISTKNADGSRVVTKKDEDGNVLYTRHLPAPDIGAPGTTTAGSTVTATLDKPGAPATDDSTIWWANDDGTKTYVTKNPDGSKTVVKRDASGVVVSTHKVPPTVPGAAGAGTTPAAPKTAAAVRTATALKPAAPAPRPVTPPASTPKLGTGAVATSGSRPPSAAGSIAGGKLHATPPVVRGPNSPEPVPAPKAKLGSEKKRADIPAADYGVVGDQH